MQLTRCPNHHYYDMEKYAECPQCKETAGHRKKTKISKPVSTKSGNQSAEISSAPVFPEKTAERTVLLSAENETEHTVLLDSTDAENNAERTVLLDSADAENNAERTVMLGSADAESENGLTVGWLVCVQGVHRGKSFALRPGQNFIGRSSAMDIRLYDEISVSKEFHAGVIFDPVSGNFFLIPGESHGLTYLNGTLVFSPSALKDYDKILFGSCCCIFRSFCNENFDWNNELGT